MNKSYSVKKTVKKVLKLAILFGGPVLIDSLNKRYALYLDMSIGAGLYVIYDVLKHWAKVRLP